MTRTELMEDFELAFAHQADCGNFSFARDTLRDANPVYTDHTTYWAFQAWVSSYETYAKGKVS